VEDLQRKGSSCENLTFELLSVPRKYCFTQIISLLI